MQLAAVTSAGQLRAALDACPALATEGLDAEHELLPVLGWDPAAAWPTEGHARLLRALSPSVPDVALAAAYQIFDRDRATGMAQAREAGYRQAIWLAEHRDATAAEWDKAAREAIHLLGLGGDEWARAALLDGVGTHVVRRPDATPAQVTWCIECLREGRALWHDLGDSNQQAAVGGHLAAALYTWEYGDAFSNVREAEGVMREVCDHYERTGAAQDYAMAVTNLSVVLSRYSRFGWG